MGLKKIDLKNQSLEIGYRVNTKINDAMANANSIFKDKVFSNPQDFFIYIPSPVLEDWFIYLEVQFGIKVNPNDLRYRGIKVLPGYESKVVLAHKNSVMYANPNHLISSVDL